MFYSQFSQSQTHISTHAVHYKKKGIVNQNLILHLDASHPNSLDPNDLSVWNDLSSSNNDLSLFSGTMQFSSDAGGSLVFDNDIYKRDSDLNNMSSTNITISMWVKTTVSSCYLSSLSRSLGNTGYYYEFVINIRANGTFRFWDYKTDSSSPKYGFPNNSNNVSNTIINNGNWKFITFTKDNLTGKYYVNSSLDRTVTANTNVNYGFDNFLIGKNWRDNNLPYNGSIGAVYIYTKTLSLEEITQNYNATKSRYGY